MKARAGDVVVTRVAVSSDFGDSVVPAGARGTVVEVYEQPREGYAVDLEIPDASLAGGLRYESVVLLPDQFDPA